MDEMVQFGHPDADQLNAWMEDALPAAERERTLAHLATCADCRMVVALASGAEFPAPVAAAVLPVARPWWRVPVWVWGVPLAGVAALAFFTVHREAKVVAPVGEARVVTPDPLVVPEKAPAVVAAPKAMAARGAGGGGQGAGGGCSGGGGGCAGGCAAYGDGGGCSGCAPAAVTAPAPMVAARNGLNASAAASGGMGYVAAPAPPPLVAAAPTRNAMVTLGQARGAGQTVGLAAQPMAAAKPAAAAKADSGTVLTGAALDALADDAGTGRAKRMMARPLPSGLAVVSETEGAGATVALDSGNQVFVTRDGGAHWAAVEAKWKGKAVRVGLVGAPMMTMDRIAGEQSAMNSVVGGNSSVTGLVTVRRGRRFRELW